MKKTATLIQWVTRRMITRCKSNVKNYLTVLFLLSGLMFATQKSDAQCNSFGIDFKQGANRDGGYEPGQIHWIGSILQNSNSRYIEGMSTLQRIVMNNLPSCGDGYHSLRIKMQSRKGDNHAYDFLTSWDNAFLAAAAIAPGFDIFPTSRTDAVNDLNECGDEIGACAATACGVATGGSFLDLPINDGETNLLIEGPPADQNTIAQIIPEYETRYGDRTVRVYVGPAGFGGTPADNQVVFVGYGDANPNDGGDSYIYYDIKWVSTSPDVVIEFGAHIAVGVDGLAVAPSLGVGYLLNRGASAISGGPYHVIVEDFQSIPNNDPKCEGNLGNLDNQLQGSQILLIPSCDLEGPSSICASGTATYTAEVTNPSGATYLWEIIGSSQAPPAATINGSATGNVPAPISPATTTPLSITVSAGGIGSYTVKLTINNGGQTGNTTDDDISSSCTVTTTVTGGPSIVCPPNTTVDPCQTQAQINTAYAAWLALVTPAGASHNGGTVGPDKCGGTSTVVFTATNSCGSATCSATFTVTADNTPPAFTGSYADVTLGCNPADPTGSLGSATATDNCGATTITQSDGAISSDGCTRARTRTFTARDGCNNTATTTRTVRWIADVTPPGFTGNYDDVTLGCNPGNPDGSLGTANAADGCGAVTITQSDGSVVTDGCNRSRTRTFTARDGCNNTATISRTVRWISDVTPPSFTGSYADVTLGCNPANPDGSLGSASATDACGAVTITLSDGAVVSDGCARSKTRTFTARDGCNNTATISRTVRWIFDVTPPVFTSSTTPIDLGCQVTVDPQVLGNATATDACSVPTITSSDGDVVSNGCSRSVTRTYTARDACGNTATISRTVTFIYDPNPPVFTGNYADVTLGCNPANPDGSLGTANATDACGPVTLSQSDGPVTSDGCSRARTRTFTARDACNNTATISRTVRWISDVTPPVFSGNYSDVTLGCNPGNPDGSLGSASASDACGAVTISQSDGAVVSDGCSRSRTRTFTARDGCNNTATVSRTVRWISDVTPPVFSGNYNDVTLGCNPGDPDGSLGTANASDACGPVTLSQSDGPVVSDGCSRSRTRTFTARDGCNNTATVSRTVRWISDVTPPAFTGSYTDVDLGCNPGNPDGSLGSASATDACGPVTISQSDGAVQSNGCARSRTRTFTARDGCNNTATTSRTVRWISDVTPPVFSGNYSDVTLGCNPANPDGSLGSAGASDACGAVTISQSDGAVQSSGCNRSRTRTFVARDGCQNTSSVSRTVRWVSDLTGPTIVCAASYTAECGVTPTFAQATATDACGGATVTAVGEVVVQGTCPTTYTRTWRAIDACGNTSTCSQTITVPCCAENCTYTQGAYGSANGEHCDGENTYDNTTELLNKLLGIDPGPANPLTIGRAGRSLTVPATADGRDDFIEYMPGGGSAAVLPLGDCDITTACINSSTNGVPNYLKNDNFKNVLVGQTFALSLNLRLSAGLGSFDLQGGWLVTQEQDGCGDDAEVVSCAVDAGALQSFPINAEVVAYLDANYGGSTVADLLDLANDALGGVLVNPGSGGVPSLSNINSVVDAINRGFDECRSFYGWSPCQVTCANVIYPDPCNPPPVTRITTTPMAEVSADQLAVSAYPNPFTDRVRFVVRSKVAGQGSLEIYNMLGQKIETVYRGTIVAERSQVVEYKTTTKLNGGLIYIFRVGGKQVTGKLLKIEQ